MELPFLFSMRHLIERITSIRGAINGGVGGRAMERFAFFGAAIGELGFINTLLTGPFFNDSFR